MQKYNPKKIEPKWQKFWEKEKLFKAVDNNAKRPKFYCLDMFPYPSGEGLHVGHPEGYTATDIYSRYMRMNGYNVLHPMGWDAFGLPAENYAIKCGIHPQISIAKNIKRFKKQIESLGFGYDWDREINTSDPSYYKWTQWLFLELYKKGLAYKKKAPVNWCDSCQTVLAREQVVDGRCERCGKQVRQKELKQWFFRITDYADRLLTDLDGLDWPDKIKKMQENWIGRSEGALLKFEIRSTKSETNSKFEARNPKQIIDIFTTRPDTIFGATYLVLAPEHDLVLKLKNQILNFKKVSNYIKKTQNKTELERTSLEKIKTGVELKGIKAVNPATKKEIPIYIADYVLTTYGTGAIMAVPAHDERDFEFAKKYKLPIIEVIKSKIKKSKLKNQNVNSKCKILESTYTYNGTMINSGKFNGENSEKIKDNITKFISGKKSIQYRIKDWLISRQRYWGAPIPIIYCDSCGIVPVPENDLPIKLPNDVDFRPTGESPLVRSKKFQNIKCPKCQSPAHRESDTMDTFVCSSWYYLRYCDPRNNKRFAASGKLKKWLPVDLYIGGAEHAVMHLLYARFITKALKDMKYINFNEPFLKLRNQGLILAPDGRKMSKSLGNVINPDDIVDIHGADTMRLYEMFMGPLEDEKPWDTKGIVGIKRFLDRVWNIVIKLKTQNLKVKTTVQNSNLLNQTMQKVTNNIKDLKFNTAISAMMIFTNEISKNYEITIKDFEKFLIILSPFAPHIAEELWHSLGNKKSIFTEKWPEYKEIKKSILPIAIQVNGKVRGIISVYSNQCQEDIVKIALKEKNVAKYMANKRIKKIIYISGRILSIVV